MLDRPLPPELARFHDTVRLQVPLVRKMHRDEAWYRGEALHHAVGLEDPAVVLKVCDIILGLQPGELQAALVD